MRNIKIFQREPRHTVRVDPALTVPIPTGTGGSNEGFVLDDADKQRSALLDRLPVENASFLITMDYKRNVIMVTIKNPYDSNLNQFKIWLKDNTYNLIPDSQFQYLRGSN